LIAACSSHYFAAHPWPDLGDWRAIRDPQQRLERALDELYAYYERTEPMFSNVLHDAALVDFAREAVVPLRDDNSSRERPATRWPSPPWRSLSTKGVGRPDTVELITALVEAARGVSEPPQPALAEPPAP
jgi:hypothetical protein